MATTQEIGLDRMKTMVKSLETDMSIALNDIPQKSRHVTFAADAPAKEEAGKMVHGDREKTTSNNTDPESQKQEIAESQNGDKSAGFSAISLPDPFSQLRNIGMCPLYCNIM